MLRRSQTVRAFLQPCCIRNQLRLQRALHCDFGDVIAAATEVVMQCTRLTRPPVSVPAAPQAHTQRPAQPEGHAAHAQTRRYAQASQLQLRVKQ